MTNIMKKMLLRFPFQTFSVVAMQVRAKTDIRY